MADGNIPDSTRAVYGHLLRQNSADAIGFLFSDRLSAALQLTVRHHLSPAGSIEELRRLLAIKAFVSDTDGTKLEPTPLMDEVWRAVILDTMLYTDLQIALGCTLHRPTHYGDDNEDKAKQAIRLRTLRLLYTSFFESQPLTNTPHDWRRRNMNIPAVKIEIEDKKSQDEEYFEICIADSKGSEVYFKVRPLTKISKLQEAYAVRAGQLPDSVQFMYDGSKLDPKNGSILSDYDFPNAGLIMEVMIEQCGC